LGNGFPVLSLGLRFAQTDNALAIFPLTALAQQINALEALENRAVFFAATTGGLETVVL
jgi:hypothetical protein